MNKKIRIYLDTSDYSRFARQNPTLVDREIFEKLLGFVESGKVEIGYSFWVIAELIQNASDEFRLDRVRRGAIVKQLCGRNAFPHPVDIAKGYKFPNDGIWMPRSAVDEFSTRKLMINLATKIKTHERLNRNFRRALKDPTRLKALIANGLRNNSITSKLFDDFPVTDEFIEGDYFRRFFGNEISELQLDQELVGWISDPSLFFDLWYKYSNLENPIRRLVESSYESLNAKLEQYFSYKTAAVTAYENHVLAYENMAKTIQSSKLPSLIIEALEKTTKPVKPKNIEFADQQFSSILPNGEYLNCYFNAIFSAKARYAKSDLVDLMHMSHHTEVDLIRCDKKMFSIFRDCGHIERGKLVEKIEDLVPRIEAM